MKKDLGPIPGGKGSLYPDFRVDEEPGMSHAFDPRLAPKGQASGQLALVDRIVKLQREKVNQLRQGDSQVQ